MDIRKHSATSQIIRVFLLNASSSDGLTGLDETSSGLIISAIADVEASTTAYTEAAGNIETIATLGTYAAPTSGKCRFAEVDATNHPGLYEIQLADARFAVSNAERLHVGVLGAASLRDFTTEIQLVAFDPHDAAALGLSRIDAAISSRLASADITLASGEVTVGTNNDKTGYAIDTNNDKTGYSVATNNDKTGYEIAGTKNRLDDLNDFDNSSSQVTVQKNHDKRGYELRGRRRRHGRPTAENRR